MIDAASKQPCAKVPSDHGYRHSKYLLATTRSEIYKAIRTKRLL